MYANRIVSLFLVPSFHCIDCNMSGGGSRTHNPRGFIQHGNTLPLREYIQRCMRLNGLPPSVACASNGCSPEICGGLFSFFVPHSPFTRMSPVIVWERYRLTGLQTTLYTVALVLHPHNYLIPMAELSCHPTYNWGENGVQTV